MSPIAVTQQQIRKIILQATGLARPFTFGKGPDAVYNLINHLGYVQIDTNYVVERAHHHTIFARVPDYQKEWLSDLQEDGQIFEYLTSDAGFIPMHDFRFSLPIKDSFLRNRKPITKGETLLMQQVLDRVGREGPLFVTDFENDRLTASTGWWDWRPSKVALERLYLEGEMMITRTKDFKKLYDLPTNLVPPAIDTSLPTPHEFAQHVILRNLKALGVARASELAWRARFVKPNLVKPELQQLVAEGKVIALDVTDVKTPTAYTLPEYIGQNITVASTAHILSPFDPLNVFRKRLKDFFDFDYQVECFVPQPKRKYGYFSLPVLIGDRFVARMDAKADRKAKALLIHNIHFEDVTLDEDQLQCLISSIRTFTQFNQCHTVAIARCNRTDYMRMIKNGVA